jgi:hypothetical protein
LNNNEKKIDPKTVYVASTYEEFSANEILIKIEGILIYCGKKLNL